jgi:hypothetical protein
MRPRCRRQPTSLSMQGAGVSLHRRVPCAVVESGLPRGPQDAASARPRAHGSLWSTRAFEAIDHDVLDLAPLIPKATASSLNLVSEQIGNVQANPQLGVLITQIGFADTARRSPTNASAIQEVKRSILLDRF